MVALVSDNEEITYTVEVLPGQGLEEAVDQLRAMLRQERTNYSSVPDYLKASEMFPDPGNINAKWRLKICEWVFEVVDHFGFDRDVASTALDYMDRSVAASFEATGKPVTKREYQLFAVTSLYIAVKLHGEVDPEEENESSFNSSSVHESPSGSSNQEQVQGSGCTRKKLKITAYQELSRGFFTVETIEMMERKVLSLLKWRMNPPTPSQFLLQLLRFLPRWSSNQPTHSFATIVTKVYDIARYLTELSCCDASFSFESSPSHVAYASLLCAFEAVRDTTPLPDEVVSKFLCNVAVASEVLLPRLEQTRILQRKVKDLAPALFPVSQPTLARSVSFDASETTAEAAATAAASSASLNDNMVTSTMCFFNNDVDGSGRKRSRNEYETCLAA